MKNIFLSSLTISIFTISACTNGGTGKGSDNPTVPLNTSHNPEQCPNINGNFERTIENGVIIKDMKTSPLANGKGVAFSNHGIISTIDGLAHKTNQDSTYIGSCSNSKITIQYSNQNIVFSTEEFVLESPSQLRISTTFSPDVLSQSELKNTSELYQLKTQVLVNDPTVDQSKPTEPIIEVQPAKPTEPIIVVEPVKPLPGRTAEFNEITPGKFMMGEIGAQVATEITKPFEMMQTELTQFQWAYLKILMGEKNLSKINPSYFKTATGSSVVNIEGIDVQMKADHPVEQVSHEDVSQFIEGLNKLSSSGDANVQALLDKLIPGHKKGDIYDLPTEAQWEFVMRDRGNANKQYFDNDKDTDLAQYAWFDKNAGNETHAVATKQPRMIDGKPFYDLEGNVWEWNKDWYDGTLKGGKDPQGAATGSFRVIRGGSWFSNAQFLRSGVRNDWWPGYRFNNVGFRLVRTSR